MTGSRRRTTCRAMSGPATSRDDFRHRMLANVAALAFTVALTAIGIWLAMSIADLRKTQDCVLMGRRDCARISVMPQRLNCREPNGPFWPAEPAPRRRRQPPLN